MATTLDVFIHMDAVGRNDWQGSPDDRPLTDKGKEQAQHVAEELAASKVDGLFSSPAARCTQSLEPLSAATGLPVQIMPGFCDTHGYKAPEGWENKDRLADPLGGALSAGRAFEALRQIHEQIPDGRGVLCSYGDIVPALIAFLAGANQQQMPAKDNSKGAIFTIAFDGTKATLAGRAPKAGFPQ